MKVVGDLFLTDFTKKMNAAWDSPAQVLKFHNDLSEYHWADPACGSGNFLVVALKQMRSLELRVMARLQELDGPSQLQLDATWGQRVGLHQFHGIEIDPTAAEIATVAMWLTDHQMNQRWANGYKRIPLVSKANIHQGNALPVRPVRKARPGPHAGARRACHPSQETTQSKNT
jgi:hypothetical protein